MTRKPIFSRTLVLAAVALVILHPVEQFRAQSQDVNARISTLEIRSDQVAEQRRQVRENLNKANQFARIAAGWFARLNQVETEIKGLENQKQSGNFNIYDNRQLDDQLQALRQKRESINRLDGGQVIDGVPYASLFQLQEEAKQKGGEAVRLNNEVLQLTQQLRALDRERDGLISQALDQEKLRLQADKATLRYLQEDLALLQSLVDNNGLWLLNVPSGLGFGVPHVSREMAVTMITNEYLLSLQTTPGKKADSRELAATIKNFQAQSNKLKGVMRDRLIPEAIREINDLQRRIQRLEGGSPDIQGCWVIVVGNDNYPVVTIAGNHQGDYEAIFTKVGQLDFFKRGDKLFSVARINDNTYDGTEYSFTADGRPAKIPLRLIVSRDGNSINYRADSLLTLRRCN